MKPFQWPKEIGLLFSIDKAKRNCECSVESGNTCDLQKRYVKSINPICAIKKKDLMIPFPLPDGPLEYKEDGIDSTILRPMNPIINLRRGVKYLQENLGRGKRTVFAANQISLRIRYIPRYNFNLWIAIIIKDGLELRGDFNIRFRS